MHARITGFFFVIEPAFAKAKWAGLTPTTCKHPGGGDTAFDFLYVIPGLFRSTKQAI
jgi:hypothetical protein